MPHARSVSKNRYNGQRNVATLSVKDACSDGWRLSESVPRADTLLKGGIKYSNPTSCDRLLLVGCFIIMTNCLRVSFPDCRLLWNCYYRCCNFGASALNHLILEFGYSLLCLAGLRRCCSKYRTSRTLAHTDLKPKLGCLILLVVVSVCFLPAAAFELPNDHIGLLLPRV